MTGQGGMPGRGRASGGARRKAGASWAVWFERTAWIAILAFIGWRIWPQAAAALGTGSSGERAPEMRLTTLSGQPLALSELQGRVVLVNFWATWCPPCRFEIPGFQAVYESYRGRGFTVVGVATDRGTEGSVRSFLAERGITYPVGMATTQAEQAFGGVNVLPTSFLIDRRGRIRYRVQGVFTQAALRQAVDRLVAERGR